MQFFYVPNLVKGKRTLLITCVECNLLPCEEHDDISVYTTLACVLDNTADALLESIEYFVVQQQCEQILLIAHYRCKAMDFIMESSGNKYQKSLRDHLGKLQLNYHVEVSKADVQPRLLTEVNVVEQCKMLVTLPVVKERIECGHLEVRGLVFDERNGTFKDIFSNGVVMNTLISLC